MSRCRAFRRFFGVAAMLAIPNAADMCRASAPDPKSPGRDAKEAVRLAFRTGYSGGRSGEEEATACAEVKGEKIIFCKEGFYAGRTSSLKNPPALTDAIPADKFRFAKATGIGYGLGQKKSPHDRVEDFLGRSSASARSLRHYIIDGWGFSKFMQNREAPCSVFEGRQRSVCEFGAGRASYFMGRGTPGDGAGPAFTAGVAYAGYRVTGQAHEHALGERDSRVGELAARLRIAAKKPGADIPDARSLKFAACMRRFDPHAYLCLKDINEK